MNSRYFGIVMGLLVTNGLAAAPLEPRALDRNTSLGQPLRGLLDDYGVNTQKFCVQKVITASGARRFEFSNRECPSDGVVPANETAFSLASTRTTPSGNRTLTLERRAVGRAAWTRTHDGGWIYELKALCTGIYYDACTLILDNNGELFGIRPRN